MFPVTLWCLPAKRANKSQRVEWMMGAPARTSLKPKAPILLHPQVSVGSTQAIVLTVEKTSWGPIPRLSLLLTCGHEMSNQTYAGKSQPQYCCPREYELKHYNSSNHSRQVLQQTHFQVLQPELRHSFPTDPHTPSPCNYTWDGCALHSLGSP